MLETRIYLMMLILTALGLQDALGLKHGSHLPTARVDPCVGVQADPCPVGVVPALVQVKPSEVLLTRLTPEQLGQGPHFPVDLPPRDFLLS
jgi:hypothetical protein